ncbi:MAG TPA: A24 family peptidase [Microlunatus sp.]|nr:A24 family peptidase [Microlunatus sp.]
MSVIVIVGAALVSGLAASALTRWMRRVAGVESFWLASGLHVAFAVVAGAGAAALADGWAEMVGYTLLGLGCALLVVIDLAALRLPDVVVGPLYLVMLITLAVAAGVNGEPLRFVRAVGAAALLVGVYFVLAFISPSGMGLGDVKFAGVLGLFLGWLGWPQVILGMLAAFLLSAAVGLALMAVKRISRKTALPFGPWMVAGAAIGAAWGSTVLL